MSKAVKVVIVTILAQCINCKNDYKEEKCYEGLGCVKLAPEWFHPTFRPVNYLPSERHAVNTIFISWSLIGTNLTSNVIGTNQLRMFDLRSHQKLLIHDFTSNGYTGWVQHLARAILMSTEAPYLNVVSVDWSAGAEPPYAQAVANARLVALEASHFLTQYRDCKTEGLTSKTFHVIGHGVGAHIAGYIGKLIPIDRITALDPAGTYFTNMPPPVRLHKSDARYVDAVHTHTQPYGQGYKDVIGHTDFYPNGGKRQPGCADTYVKLTSLKRGDLQLGQTLSACSHKRSIKYFIEALIKPACEYIGIACPSFNDFIKGKCHTCGNKFEYCAQLHPLLHTHVPNKNNTFGFYMITSSSAPFCGEMLKVNIVLQSKRPEQLYVKGYFTVTIPQQTGDVNFSLNENHSLRSLRTNDRHSFLVFRSTPPPLELPAHTIHVKWNHGIPCAACTAPKIAGLTIEKISTRKQNTFQLFCEMPGSLDALSSTLQTCTNTHQYGFPAPVRLMFPTTYNLPDHVY